MDKKQIAGLLGAVAGVVTVSTVAQAAPAPTVNMTVNDSLVATSHADLLAPVPDALAALEADDAARAQALNVDGVQLAKYYHHHHHYRRRHHHHHHHYRRHHSRWWYRHHHHHHHAHAFIGIPGVGGVVVHSDRD